jgi:SAM-dependent methyltransferase
MFKTLKQIYTDPRVFPTIEEEIGDYVRYFKGKVLNAGAGNRDISHLVDGKLYNQDLENGPLSSDTRPLDFVGPIHKIPVEDGFFDVVINNAVMEHVSNPHEIMREMHRVLRSDGILYLVVPFMQPEHKCPTDYQRYTLDGLKQLAVDHDFEVLHADGVHTVYQTLTWICWDWLKDSKRLRERFIKWVLFPVLWFLGKHGKRQCSTLYSAHRVVARKVAP